MAKEEEEKREPDLDELLELFREPEPEPRKPLIPRWGWMLMALALGAGGMWAAADATRGRDRRGHDLGPPLLPTKSSHWSALVKSREPADLRQYYIGRCRLGMTVRQVRWVVEDFERLGLDAPPPAGPAEAFLRYRKSQHAWYLDLLREGLRLTHDQRAAAAGKLAALYEEARDAAGQDPSRLIDAAAWLEDERYAPWNLCDLTGDQQRLTWQGTAEADEGTPWFDAETVAVADPAGDDPGFSADFPAGEAPDLVPGAGSVFPFVSGQEFRRGDGKSPLLDQATGCHTAQWMTCLLVRPGLARQALDAASQ